MMSCKLIRLVSHMIMLAAGVYIILQILEIELIRYNLSLLALCSAIGLYSAYYTAHHKLHTQFCHNQLYLSLLRLLSVRIISFLNTSPCGWQIFSSSTMSGLQYVSLSSRHRSKTHLAVYQENTYQEMDLCRWVLHQHRANAQAFPMSLVRSMYSTGCLITITRYVRTLVQRLVGASWRRNQNEQSKSTQSAGEHKLKIWNKIPKISTWAIQGFFVYIIWQCEPASSLQYSPMLMWIAWGSGVDVIDGQVQGLCIYSNFYDSMQ
jgi:hypothetical protein